MPELETRLNIFLGCLNTVYLHGLKTYLVNDPGTAIFSHIGITEDSEGSLTFCLGLMLFEVGKDGRVSFVLEGGAFEFAHDGVVLWALEQAAQTGFHHDVDF